MPVFLRFIRLTTCLALCAAATALAEPAPAGAAPGAGDPAAAVAALRALGLENLAARDSSGERQVSYENRRYRRSADALGRVERDLGGPATVFEKRLGMTAAAIRPWRESRTGDPVVELPADPPSPMFGRVSETPLPARDGFDVRYPYEAGFPREPAWGLQRPTWRSLDLTLGVLFDYELGRIYQPLLYRVALEPMLRYTPWPGGLARAGLVVPIEDRFDFDPLVPDADRVRPGPLAFEQFAWIPQVGLLSADAGYFGDNRYGASAGLARPIEGGRFVLDAQADVTGFIAFTAAGTEYSTARHWTGYGALVWRPGLGVSVRAKAARFLYGDDGVELEVRRSFGDAEIAFFGTRSETDDAVGVRLVLPVPPITRGTGGALRLQPVERFAVDYYSRSVPIGRSLTGVASRTDYLRQLDAPTLEADRSRLAAAAERDTAGAPGSHRDDRPPDLINWTGMTGFVNTPWAGVIEDRRVEAGYTHVPKRWAYDHRGRNDNEIYYVTLGFLPRTEASVRWTVIPGYRSFEEEVSDSRLTDTDYMASGRLCLVEPATNRPGLSLGIEDARGTRRFHSTYAVAGMPWRIESLRGRASMGYAFKALEASGRTLLGTFGAFEISPLRFLAAQIEYDTEKWNLGLAVPAPYGIRFRAALLDMRTLSVGVGYGRGL